MPLEEPDSNPFGGDATSDAASPAADAPATTAPPAPIDRRHLALLITPIIIMLVGANVGNALLPSLATDNTTLLIILGAANRNLIVAARSAETWLEMGNNVPLILYGVIGFLRLLAPDPLFYALGWHYGDTAISWMERRTPSFGEMMRQLEKVFAVAGWALVLIMPNNYVCLLAGAARMRKSIFWACNIVGTIGRLILMWFIGQALQEWIDKLLGFVKEYRIPLLVVSIGLVAFTTMREWRSGNSEIKTLLDLEHELEQDAPEPKP